MLTNRLCISCTIVLTAVGPADILFLKATTEPFREAVHASATWFLYPTRHSGGGPAKSTHVPDRTARSLGLSETVLTRCPCVRSFGAGASSFT